jgi:CheY-like chemotaxis protein
MVLAVVDDLLFSSKIRAAAERAGQPVTFVRTREGLVDRIAAMQPSLVIFDLDRDPLDPVSAIREIRARETGRRNRLVAFVRHTSTDRIAAAREAGADLVLARSAFFTTLGDVLDEAARSTDAR